MPQYEVGSEEYWAAERAKEEENRQVLIAEQGEDVVNRNPRTWKLPASPQPGVTLAPGRRLTQTGDQMPGKEYALMSQQQGIERDLQKRIIATRMEGQGRVLGYTPEQEKQIDALEKAYTTVLSKPNEWTAEQTQEYALRVQQAKNSMIKSWVKRPPTPKELHAQNSFTDDFGGVWTMNPKTGAFKRDDVVSLHDIAEISKSVDSDTSMIGKTPEEKLAEITTRAQRAIQIRAAVGGVNTKPPPPDPAIVARETAFNAAVGTPKEFGGSLSVDEMTDAGRKFAQGDPNKANEFMQMWAGKYKKEASKYPDPDKFVVGKLLPPTEKSFGKKVKNVLLGQSFADMKTEADWAKIVSDKFKAGQTIQKDGKTYTYKGNGKWDY